MSESADWPKDKRCKQCGKEFTVLYPQMWRYKLGEHNTKRTWLCSWGCLQEYRKQKEAKKIQRNEREKAKKEAEETVEIKMAVVDGNGRPKPETLGTVKRESTHQVRAVYVTGLGEFYNDRQHHTIDWRTLEGDEVSETPEGWRLLIDELPEIMKELGVEN